MDYAIKLEYFLSLPSTREISNLLSSVDEKARTSVSLRHPTDYRPGRGSATAALLDPIISVACANCRPQIPVFRPILNRTCMHPRRTFFPLPLLPPSPSATFVEVFSFSIRHRFTPFAMEVHPSTLTRLSATRSE